MAIDEKKVQSGFYMGEAAQHGAYSVKNVIEDFMKTDYQEGLRNEFNVMEALINKISKDTISAKKKYKSFALGLSDSVRAVGDTFDRYELGFDSFYNEGRETIEAEFDTTKLMALFSITDEAILKGTGDGSIIDILKDNLSMMEQSLKITMNRYTYGAPDGKIGTVNTVVAKGGMAPTLSKIPTYAGDRPDTAHGREWNRFYATRKNRNTQNLDEETVVSDNTDAVGNVNYPLVFKFIMQNSRCMYPGMGFMVDVHKNGTPGADSTRIIGKIWQKDNSKIYADTVIAYATKFFKGTAGGGWVPEDDANFAPGDNAKLATYIADVFGADMVGTVYSRQLVDTVEKAKREYCGLEAIVINNDGEYDNIFGVDRSLYTSLRPTTYDLQGNNYISEELLRDMADHLGLTSPEGTSINLVCAEHRIISAVEKSLYQFKNYTPGGASNGWQIGQVGAGEVRFDNFVLYKDAYARNQNVYMLDQTKIGELIRRDFQWITSGEVNSVLQRRPGSEMYEGIMNKYADMYIDAWKCHGAIKNCKVPGVGEYVQYPWGSTPVTP